MDEYFLWMLQVEQAQYLGVAVAVLVCVLVACFGMAIERLKELRRKHWRLLIRTVNPDTKEVVHYPLEGAVTGLLKWHDNAQNHYTGTWAGTGGWVFYKLESEATWLDRLRASRSA